MAIDSSAELWPNIFTFDDDRTNDVLDGNETGGRAGASDTDKSTMFAVEVKLEEG